MRNLLEYPISYDEAEETLMKIKEELSVGLVGDMRPAVIDWTLARLVELRKLEDQFFKLKRERMPNKGY